jgi:glycosidase
MPLHGRLATTPDDPCRYVFILFSPRPFLTVYQWSAEPNAGFTTGTPWMRVNTDYETWNVEAQEADPESVLHFRRTAHKFRAAHDVLVRTALPVFLAWCC